jgi:predicted TIM-barrel fold metal-dependent hydrolase
MCHALNYDPSNYKIERDARLLAEMVYSMTHDTMSGRLSRYLVTRESCLRDWSTEEVANILFLESVTSMSTFVPLAIFSFYDGACSLEKAAEAKKRWPDRFKVTAAVDPLAKGAVEEFERQVEMLDPIALKLYPSSYALGIHKGWRMDDPTIAFPLFEKAQQLGIKIIQIHKALPAGPVPMEPYKVGDIDDAAHAFPDLTFEIIHGGFAFSEETAWQLGRYPNIRVNLDITSMLAWTHPRRFAQVLVDLLSVAGHRAVDRIHWATGGGPASFHPQPAIEAFWNFQIPEEMWTQSAFANEPYELTELDKRKILGLNTAELLGIDVQEAQRKIARDEFSQRVAKNGGVFAPWSTTKAVLAEEAQTSGSHAHA